MSLLLTVPDAIAQTVSARARAQGRSPEEVLLSALATCFPGLSAELQEEFDAWEAASDEDMACFDAEKDPSFDAKMSGEVRR